MWGFWSMELAARLAPAVTAACQGAGGVTRLEIEADELRPQRDDVQAALGGMFATLPMLRIARVAIATSNALTRLQLLRIAKAGPARDLLDMTPPRAA